MAAVVNSNICPLKQKFALIALAFNFVESSQCGVNLNLDPLKSILHIFLDQFYEFDSILSKIEQDQVDSFIDYLILVVYFHDI